MEQALLDMPPHERLLALYRDGRIIRHEWSDTGDDGRERACLYAALVPGAESTSNCPASLMPQWLADLVPNIDDCGPDEAWPEMVLRFGRVLPWRLDAAAERRVLARTMIAALEIAVLHDTHSVVRPVAALWRQALAGDEPTREEWDGAGAAAKAEAMAAGAARARAEAKTTTAWAEAATADAKAEAAAWAVAARAAAKSASAKAAAWAATAAAAAGTAGTRAEAKAAAAATAAAEAAAVKETAWAEAMRRGEAKAETWDRITNALLSAIEEENARVAA